MKTESTSRRQCRRAASRAVSIAIIGAALLVVLGSYARRSPNWTWCASEGQPFSADLAIKGCTAVIESGTEPPRNLAIAHYNRSMAYRDKEEGDRAAADYDEATRLDPTLPASLTANGVSEGRRHLPQDL